MISGRLIRRAMLSAGNRHAIPKLMDLCLARLLRTVHGSWLQ